MCISWIAVPNNYSSKAKNFKIIVMIMMLTGSLSMNNSFGNSLAIEVRHLVHVVEVLHQHRAPLPDRLHGGLGVDGVAVTGGHRGLWREGESV